MKKMYYWLIPLAVILVMAGLSCASRRQPKIGLMNGKLSPCPGSPNCVSSEDSESPFYIEPFKIMGDPDQEWQRMKNVIKDNGGRIEEDNSNYLWATFRTKVFRFVDDLELRLDSDNSLIHVRSASRIGYSDFGLNRKRVEKLRVKFLN